MQALPINVSSCCLWIWLYLSHPERKAKPPRRSRSPAADNMQLQRLHVKRLPVVGVNVEGRDREVPGMRWRHEKVVGGRFCVGIGPGPGDRQPVDVRQTELAWFPHGSAQRDGHRLPGHDVTHNLRDNVDRRARRPASRENQRCQHHREGNSHGEKLAPV